MTFTSGHFSTLKILIDDIQGGAKVGIQWSKKEKTFNV